MKKSFKEDLIEEMEELIKEASEYYSIDEIIEFIKSEEESLIKEARLSTPAEKAKMRQYRQKNKAQLAMKAKRRSREQKQGVRRKKKRIGTAAGGYSFIDEGQGNKSGSSRGRTFKAPKMQNAGTSLVKTIGHTPRHIGSSHYKVANVTNSSTVVNTTGAANVVTKTTTPTKVRRVNNSTRTNSKINLHMRGGIKNPEPKLLKPKAFPEINRRLHPTDTKIRRKPQGAPKNVYVHKIVSTNVVKDMVEKIKKHGKTVYSEHKRILIDKKTLPESALEGLGFKATSIAIPEPGQSRQTSFRGPLGLHIHDHGDVWIAHQDKHDPKGIVSTTKHVISEGIPAAVDYLRWGDGPLKNKLK